MNGRDGVMGEGFRLSDPPSLEKVGKRLRFMRRDVLGLSEGHLAAMLRVTLAEYRRYETGEQSMSVQQLIRIAAEFKVAPAELLR